MTASEKTVLDTYVKLKKENKFENQTNNSQNPVKIDDNHLVLYLLPMGAMFAIQDLLAREGRNGIRSDVPALQVWGSTSSRAYKSSH